MNSQGNNYSSNNIKVNNNRYVNDNKKLGDRTLFSHSVDGKRYFSSLDAEIYFGETYIDNVVQISWAVEQSTMPLYGYNSFVFDDLAIGARQIGGSFVLNFTKSGLLYDILKNSQAMNRSSLNTPETLNDNSNITWTSNYDKEHKASWDRSFNVRVGYGDENKNGASTSMLVLHCVQITGCQQVMGVDGSVIAETYTFIAKDIRYDINTTSNVPASSKDINVDVEDKQILQVQMENLKIENKGTKATQLGLSPYYEVTNSYIFKMKYNHGGGNISDVKITIKRENGEIINSSMLSVGSGSNVEYTIPRELHATLDKAIKAQSALSSNNISLLCDLRFEYTINGSIQPALIMNNKKIYITQ